MDMMKEMSGEDISYFLLILMFKAKDYYADYGKMIKIHKHLYISVYEDIVFYDKLFLI